MKAAYGKKHLDRQKRTQISSDFMTIYLGISVIVLHDLYRFGTERQFRYVKALNEMMNDGLERYRERGDTERVEAVGNLYFASRRDLRDSGVEVAKIDRQYAPVEPEGWKQTRRSRGNPYERRAFLEAIDLSIAPIWYLTGLYLREEYGFGEVRLTRYYTECRKRYMEFWKSYLYCTEEGDYFCTKYKADLKKRSLAMGVEI